MNQQAVTKARVPGRDHERLSVHDKPDVADERLIENPVHYVAFKEPSFWFALQRRSRRLFDFLSHNGVHNPIKEFSTCNNHPSLMVCNNSPEWYERKYHLHPNLPDHYFRLNDSEER